MPDEVEVICNKCGISRYVTVPGMPCPVACGGVLVDPAAPRLVVPEPEPQPVVVPEPEPQPVVVERVRVESTPAFTRAIRIERPQRQEMYARIRQRAQALDDLGFAAGGDLLRRLLDDLVREFGA